MPLVHKTLIVTGFNGRTMNKQREIADKYATATPGRVFPKCLLNFGLRPNSQKQDGSMLHRQPIGDRRRAAELCDVIEYGRTLGVVCLVATRGTDTV